jgi:hypothetical protein
VKAGSNTSTVALGVVGGDGKGSLESETVKYRVTINDSFVFKTLFLLCRHFLKALYSCCQLVHILQTWWVYGSFHILIVFVRVILWTI